jgi:putative DNA primase/helicase
VEIPSGAAVGIPMAGSPIRLSPIPASRLAAELDTKQIEDFVGVLFRYAEPGTFLSLRAFDQHRSGLAPALIVATEVVDDLIGVVQAAIEAANRAQNLTFSCVFAPPICTFVTDTGARGSDLANGLALSVDVDEQPVLAHHRLEELLGPATVIVASGSTWRDPASGELQPKLHLHWRLSEPTTTDAEHVQLLQARGIAARLVGADPTGKSIVHPMRWPGTWNCKAEPRLATIIGLNEGAEIHLVEALARLSDAVGIERQEASALSSGIAEADVALLTGAMAAIPNPESHYGEWVRLCYACWNATGGSAAGRAMWDSWSKKSRKFDADEQEATWKRTGNAIRGSRPVRRIGAGTIFWLAAQHGWQRRKQCTTGGDTQQDDCQLLALDQRQKPVTKDSTASSDLVLDPRAPLDSARQLIHTMYSVDGRATLLHQSGAFFIWHGSHYVETSIEEMKASIYQFLESALRRSGDQLAPFNPTRAKVANVLEATAAVVQLPGYLRQPAWLDSQPHHPPSELIVCTNGILHIPTRTLLPHSPRYFAINALSFPFEVDILEPVEWLNFLRAIFPNDPSSIATLQELFGLLLTGETRYQKAFLIIGPKRSGKGTLARVITALLGQANVCGPTLSGLAQNFGLAPLIGKRLAIVSDARLGSRVDQQIIVERLLAISGEDSLTIDRKFREPWTGRLDVRFLILSNELPRLADASGALASRFVTFRLGVSFYGREDLGLGDRILLELPSILSWALDGWDRLHSRGQFVPPASAQELQQELEDLASPISAFIRERCVVGPDAAVRIDDIYDAWCEWCQAHGRDHAGTVQVFGRDLRAAVPGLSTSHPRTQDGLRERFYLGIGVV